MPPAAEGEALERLATILAQAEFRDARATRNLLQIWSQALGDWLWDLLLGLLEPVGAALSPQRSWLDLAIVASALLAALLIGWFVLRAIGLGVVREARVRAEVAAERRARSDSLWRQAQDLAAQGRLAEATRTLYLSALYALEEHAMLQVQAALTNREHAERLLRERPELSQVFATLVQRYDRLRYGGHQVDSSAFAELRGLVEQTRALTA